jgi:hypothetical protein
MRCHHHVDAEAVAVCVSCGRGLCGACRQTTADERALCGLPQCTAFANRQRAVQAAIRQDCANNAAMARTLTRALTSGGVVLMLVSIVLSIGMIGQLSLRPRPFTLDDLFIFALLATVFAIGAVLWRIGRSIVPLTRNWEDISKEFD